MAGIREEMATDEYNTLVDPTSDLGSRIRVSLDFLCNNTMNLQQVLVHLLSHGLLSQRESEIVENEKSNYDRFRQLFTVLIPRLGQGNNSQHFVNVILKSGNEHILEMLKSADVTKDFAPGPLDTSSRNVRFNVDEPVPSFFGREDFLRDLHKQILQSQMTNDSVSTTSTILSRICVVTGLGGIGKTETIRKYIHSYGHRYHHVVWIDAEEHKTAENQFRRLALQELKLPTKGTDNFDFILKDVYDRLCTSNTLLILDNAEALDDRDPQRNGIARFLPTSLPPTHLKPIILLTSRQLEWPDLQKTPLPLWPPKESSEFIFRQLNLQDSDVNGRDATTLSETFNGLPLAIQAAAAVILQESKWNDLLDKDVYTIQHLLSDYNKEKRKVLEKLPPGSPDTQPLMHLWKVSLDKIRQQPHGHLATQILDVMAHLSPTNIPIELIFFIFNSNEERSLLDALELLVDYSMVHDSSNHLSIHRMLQDVTLAHLETPTEENPKERKLSLLAPPLTRITTALNKYWPTLPTSSEVYDAVHENLVHVAISHVLPKVQDKSIKDLNLIKFIEFVFVAIQETRWVEVEKFCRVLIAFFTSSASPSYSPFMSSFRKVQYLRRILAEILREKGRYKEAVDIFHELLSSVNSLEDQEDVVGEIMDTKHRLALILDTQGKHEEAIELYSSVLDLSSNFHGPVHPPTLATKSNLALALYKSGRLNEAKTLYAEIVEVMMKVLGPFHPDTLSTMHKVAGILKEEGRYDEALEILRKVVEMRERELGPLHADILLYKQSMADVLENQGKHEEALRIYSQVISSFEKASAASHPECLNAKNNTAVILGKQGRLDEAKEMFCRVLDERERVLGPNHVDTLDTKHNVAFVLQKQGKDAEALKLYEEVLELQTKQLGPMHRSTLRTNNFIGWLHLKMGNFEKAESILKEVLAARQATLPSDHPDIKETEKLYEEARLRNNPFTNEK